MREVLSACKRHLLFAFFGSTIPVLVGMLGEGRGYLFGGYLVGWLLGAAFWHGIARRIERSAALSVGGARQEMLVGLVFRLLTVALVLGLASRFSREILYAAIAGLLISFFAILLVLLIYGKSKASG